MRGDKELACLIELQNSIFAINPFNSKSFRDVTDEEFEKEHIMYISTSAHRHYFGMSQDDCTVFENALRLAGPNPSPNSFRTLYLMEVLSSISRSRPQKQQKRI